MGYKVAVVGATGNVGREMLNILSEREFPADEVFAIASRRSMGVEVSFGDRRLKMPRPRAVRFHRRRLRADVGRLGRLEGWSPKIGAQGSVVIDNSSCWRYDPDVPLIVPEVNPDARRRLHQEEHHRQSQLLDRPARRGAEAAARLCQDQARGGRHLSVGVGRRQGGMDELWDQTKGIFVADPPEPKKFTKQIAFNVIPHIDVFMEDGSTKEEWKMVVETKKILDPKIKLTATCVRVPVFVGHSEAVNIEFEKPITAERGPRILREAPGVLVVDKREPGGYVTPVECAGEYAIYRQPHPRGPDASTTGCRLWVVSDNLRKGAALNAVQIAETIINRNLLKKAA